MPSVYDGVEVIDMVSAFSALVARLEQAEEDYQNDRITWMELRAARTAVTEAWERENTGYKDQLKAEAEQCRAAELRYFGRSSL